MKIVGYSSVGRLFLLKFLVVGGTGGFVAGADAAGDGFAGGEAGAAEFAIFFQLLLCRGGEASPGDGCQAFGLDWFSSQFTNPVGALPDAHHCFIDFINGILFRGKAAEGEVAVEAVGAGIGHVEAEGGLFLGSVLDQIALMAEEKIAHFFQAPVLGFPFRRHVFVRRRAVADNIRSHSASARRLF